MASGVHTNVDQRGCGHECQHLPPGATVPTYPDPSGQSQRSQPHIPPSFSPFPHGWYHACSIDDLKRGGVRADIGGKAMLLFLGDPPPASPASGAPSDSRVSAIDARCCHMGSDLGLGNICRGKDGHVRVRCTLHGWEFDSSGQCVRIPATKEPIPGFARQTRYPTSVIAGHVFVFNGPKAAYPNPFFEGIMPEDLRPAKPFEFEIKTAWHVIAGNSFDAQHFAATHDRQILGPPRVTSPHPFARRFEGDFAVVPTSMRDRAAILVNGGRVRLQVTCWGGGTLLVVATLRSTTSYGHVTLHPMGPNLTKVRVIVWVPRSRSMLGRAIADPIDAAVRSWFIRDFAAEEVPHLAGVVPTRARMIDADQTLADFFDWLRPISWGLTPEHSHVENHA